ncbi:hypothetical protein [Streptomyces sp. NPDC002990]
MPLPLSQPHMPRSHRARRKSRHAAAATDPPAGRRAVRQPSLLPVSGRLRPGVICAGAAALLAVAVTARAGAFAHVRDFLDYAAGVLSLVSLTATVLWGLLATDRMLLWSGHRLLAQGVHRGLAVAGLGFLALHIWVKVAQGQTSAASVVLPFADRDRPVLIGLGTLAGYLFVTVAVSGAVRSVFATDNRSLWWRALHFGAYPAWGASLVHALKAGRPAGPAVTAAYALCLIGVAGVLALRLRARMRGRPSRPAGQPAVAPEPGRVPRRPCAKPSFMPVPPVEPLAAPDTGRGPLGPAPPPRPLYAPYVAPYAPGRAAGRAARHGDQPDLHERAM